VPSAPGFPAPLLSREGPPPAGSGGLTGSVRLPRTGVFQWTLNFGGAIGRYTVSSRRLVGPVVLGDAQWWWGGAIDPPALSLEFGWSTSPVTEVGVAVTTAKNWNTFHSDAQSGPTLQNAALTSFKHHTTRGIPYFIPVALNQLIGVDECFLVVSAIQTGGAAVTNYGSVAFTEDVDRDSLRSFR